jgi:hypothetical protein
VLQKNKIMRKIVSITLLLGISISVKSQSFLKEYSYNVSDSYQTDNSSAICVLPSGNIILIGDNVRGNGFFNAYGYGTLTKLNSQGVVLQTIELSLGVSGSITTLNKIGSNKIVMTSGMGSNGSVMTIDTSLNVLSYNEYYGGGQFYYCRLTQTEKTTDNNYVSVGTSGGLSNAQASLWVLKTTLTGNVLWGKGFGLGGDEDGADIIEISGSYYAYGYGTGHLGYTVPWLVKIDGNGDLKWAKIIKAPYGGGNCRTILKTTNNNLLLTYEASYNSSSNNSAKSDICITVIDTNGVNVWSKKYLSPTFNAIGQTLIDEQNNIYFSGFLDQDTSYRFVGNIDEAMPYITKLDPTGNVQWSKGILDTSKYVSPLLESPLANNFTLNNEGVFFAFTAAHKDSLTDGGSRERFKSVLSKISHNGEGCVYDNPTTSISFTPSIIDVTSSTDVLSGSTKDVSSITTSSINISGRDMCNNEVGLYSLKDTDEDFNVFPNPVLKGEKINVRGKKINRVDVFGINGDIKKSIRVNDMDEVTFSVNLPGGIYFVGIHAKDNFIQKKIIFLE